MYKLKYQEKLNEFEERINALSDVDLAYIAGIFDGEGFEQ
jgi:hypothetical protein